MTRNKKQPHAAIRETAGWTGVALVCLSYLLLSTGIIGGNNLFYHLLILAGSLLVAFISFAKRAYQPFALNLIFAFLAIVALWRLFSA